MEDGREGGGGGMEQGCDASQGSTEECSTECLLERTIQASDVFQQKMEKVVQQGPVLRPMHHSSPLDPVYLVEVFLQQRPRILTPGPRHSL